MPAFGRFFNTSLSNPRLEYSYFVGVALVTVGERLVNITVSGLFHTHFFKSIEILVVGIRHAVFCQLHF